MFTEAPCVMLLQSTWQEAMFFPRFGQPAAHHPALQPGGTVAETRGAVQDHKVRAYAIPLRVPWRTGKVTLHSKQFLDSLTWVGVVKRLGDSSPVANESWSAFPAG